MGERETPGACLQANKTNSLCACTHLHFHIENLCDLIQEHSEEWHKITKMCGLWTV